MTALETLSAAPTAAPVIVAAVLRLFVTFEGTVPVATEAFRPPLTGGPATRPRLTVAALVVTDADTKGVPPEIETGFGVTPGACIVISTVPPAPGTACNDVEPVVLI